MINLLRNWCYSAPPAAGQPAQANYSSISDTIIAAALSALALFTANGFERTNPALATMLRLAAGGIGLMWLFSRCCSDWIGAQQPVGRAAPAPVNLGYFNWFGPRRHVVVQPPLMPQPAQQAHLPPVRPAPVSPRGFSAVQRASQPDPVPLHVAPVSRSMADPVVAPAPVTHAPWPTATTTTYRPVVTRAPVAPPFAPAGSGFPATQRAPAQQSVFPATRKVADPIWSRASGNGNQRLLFPAAATRT